MSAPSSLALGSLGLREPRMAAGVARHFFAEGDFFFVWLDIRLSRYRLEPKNDERLCWGVPRRGLQTNRALSSRERRRLLIKWG